MHHFGRQCLACENEPGSPQEEIENQKKKRRKKGEGGGWQVTLAAVLEAGEEDGQEGSTSGWGSHMEWDRLMVFMQGSVRTAHVR